MSPHYKEVERRSIGKWSIFWENLYQINQLNRVVEEKDKRSTRKRRKWVNSETNVVGDDELQRKICLLETVVQDGFKSLRIELNARTAPCHEDDQHHQISLFPDGGLNESTSPR